MPGCTCGAPYHEALHSDLSDIDADTDSVSTFERPLGYDSDRELQEFFDANDPTVVGRNIGVMLMLSAGAKRSADSTLEHRDHEDSAC